MNSSSSQERNNMDKVIIIAEAGVNHNGDIVIAKKLIEVAAKCKVDFVKFQTWVTEENIDNKAPKAQYQIDNDGAGSQYEMLKKLELSFEDFIELNDYAKELGVNFLSTPDEITSLNFLVDKLNMTIIKIGSGELNNIPFLRKVGEKNRDVIISTGMSKISEVEIAYDTLLNAGAKSVSILHCTTSYPAPYKSINLKAMNVLKCAFKTNIGYSDHSEGNEVSIAAVALGAKIIEKHFTLDKNLPGPDHKASMNPEELQNLVVQIRNVENALSGSGRKEIQDNELAIKSLMTKGIYLKESIKKGQMITEEILQYKRPLVGISTSHFDLIINKFVKNDIKAGAALLWNDIDL
jgi:N-acetylneuraminate synthase